MFTLEERARLRSELLEYAAGDPRISGAAITGSAADGNEDRWSDIDLAFGVRDGGDLPNVLFDWTSHMYDGHLALHHLDVVFGAWTYRVFVLSNTLQVDLAFVAETEFRPLAPTFRLVFGKANEPRHGSPSPDGATIGLGWLYALHARSCIARGKLWQAEYMISRIRDHALTMACTRHGLASVHGRGLDLLPGEVTAQFEDSFVRQLDSAELSRAFRIVTHGLLNEILSVEKELGERLRDALMHLSETPV